MNGKGFYPSGSALQALEAHQQDIDIIPVPVRPRAYVEDFNMFLLPEEIKDGAKAVDISQEELRRRLDHGLDVPEWYTFPEVIEEMCRAVPPKSQQGFTLFLTGLSGAGKSTVAKVLYVKLLETQGRPRNAAGRRHRTPQPFQRTDLYQGAPQPERLAYRLCGQRNYQKPGHCHLRAHCAL